MVSIKDKCVVMRIFFWGFLVLFTLYNVYLASFLVRQGEVIFSNDVARDFLLLQELDEKKLVFIGPRSSTSGLFHGPLWTYINYPAFVIGGGNPITVSWFWILLEGIFLLTSFLMVKKLFGTLPAFVYTALISIRMALHTNGIFHSEATFFFIPLFFFTICMYVKSKKNRYLAFHMLALAALIQLNVGVGMQFLILSTCLIVWFIFKNNLWKHILTFSLLLLFLSNFIFFDLRHGLRMAKALLSTGEASTFFVPFRSWLENRATNTISLQLFETTDNSVLILSIFAFVVIFTMLHITNNGKLRHVYVLFFFYYFGYMLLSFFNKGVLLFHYIYLLIPLTTLWFVSFLVTQYTIRVPFPLESKILFVPLIGMVTFLNFNFVRGQVVSQDGFIGKHFNSWKGLSVVASEVGNMQHGKEFGYFVFAPDAFAYQPRYAMLYHFKKSHAKAFEYTKKPTTYIIAAPPPPDNPSMTYVWWRKNSVKISSEAVYTKIFPNGFTIEKFQLNQEEQRVPHDKTIELGIHFR